MERLFIGLFVAATLLIVGAALLIQEKEPVASGPVEAPAAAPSQPESGSSIGSANAAQLAKMLKAAEGSIVVVNLWATWCPPCREEMPELAKFHEKWSGKGVTFISLNADEPNSLESEVRPYVESQDLPFNVYMMGDGMEKMEKSLKAYVSGALPTTLIYDPKGNLVKMYEGGVKQATLEKWIDPYLKHVG